MKGGTINQTTLNRPEFGSSGIRSGNEPGGEALPLRIAINQVEYSNTPGGPLIHVFGRDSNQRPVHLRVTGFLPYFYAPVDEVDGRVPPPQVTVDQDKVHRSIRGEPLRRLYTNRPTDVRELRERYHNYEADIPFATRFMIDTGLTGGVAAPREEVSYTDLVPATVDAPARVCIMDIECEDERGFPDPGRDAIICIGCHDSFDNRYTTFIWQAGAPPDFCLPPPSGALKNGCFSEEMHSICVFESETAMIQGLVRYIQEKDPDIVSGWNFIEFDMPYLTRRMEVLGLKPSSLSRMEGQTERTAIRGRALFDLLLAYRKIHSAQAESYRLDAVAEAELGDKKVRFSGKMSDLWKEQPALLIEYNFKDVELCVAINEKNRIIGFYHEIARYVGCPLDRTLNSSSVIDIYILRKAYGRFVLPSKGFAAAEEFEGATVFDPSRGVKENVVVMDLKSLYPMAMMTINASPETKDPEGELHAPNGVRFRGAPDGLTRSIISELLRERDEKKSLRNRFPFGSPEYILYDIQQNVLKVIMNTYYGVSGYARFRLYDRDIGAAVTSVGRAIIEHTRNEIERTGYHVLYGDTDSCMIQLPEAGLPDTIATARNVEERVNASYSAFARDVLNAPRHYFSIKFEKVYASFFQAGRKKRYAGRLVWKEGKEVDEIDIVGFEIRRSDYPQVTKTVQRRVMEMILYGEGFDALKAYLGVVITDFRNGRYSLDEIGIPGGIGKHLSEYDVDDAHVRGAKYANMYLGMEFSKGSKPKRIYVKSVKGKFPRTDVLCFEYADQVPAEFMVDYEMMLDRTIKQPISRIIEALGWNWTDIDPSRTTLSQFGLG